MKTKIRVMVVDDHFVVRMGLAASINAELDMGVVAETGNGCDAVELFVRHRPDITLMDLRLPKMDGVEALLGIRQQFPEARVIVLSSYDGDADIQRALEAGAASYVLKSAPRDELLEVIRRVHAQGRFIPASAAVRLAEAVGQPKLTEREVEVLKGIAQGRSNKEIAALLLVSEATVKLHVTHLLGKLQAADRTQAALIALRRGIIHLD